MIFEPQYLVAGVASQGPVTDVKKKTDPVLTRAAAHIAGDAMAQPNSTTAEPFGRASLSDDLVHFASSAGGAVVVEEAVLALVGGGDCLADALGDPPSDWTDVQAPSEPRSTAATARVRAVWHRSVRFIVYPIYEREWYRAFRVPESCCPARGDG